MKIKVFKWGSVHFRHSKFSLIFAGRQSLDYPFGFIMFDSRDISLFIAPRFRTKDAQDSNYYGNPT